jgi:hypothetical protein
MVATFTTSLFLAVAGAALMGIGGAAGAPRAKIAARRLIMRNYNTKTSSAPDSIG